jgi:hypothetical protein
MSKMYTARLTFGDRLAITIALLPMLLLCVGYTARGAGVCPGTIANRIACPNATPTAACQTYNMMLCQGSRSHTVIYNDWFGCAPDVAQSHYCYPLENPDHTSLTHDCAKTYQCVWDAPNLTCKDGNQIGNTITGAIYDNADC